MEFGQVIGRDRFDFDPSAELEIPFYAPGDEAGFDESIYIRMHTQRDVLFILFLEDETEVVFDIVHQHDA